LRAAVLVYWKRGFLWKTQKATCKLASIHMLVPGVLSNFYFCMEQGHYPIWEVESECRTGN